MHPHFLVIGAQKSGTTWLTWQLRAHRQIWTPPEKELHYFNLPIFPFSWLRYIPTHGWARNRIRHSKARCQRRPELTEWYDKYNNSLRTFKWYQELFSAGVGKVVGEATPHYALLSSRKIKKIHSRLPELKIIYIVRDPIERAWSHLAMYQERRFGRKGLDLMKHDEILKTLNRGLYLNPSRYHRVISEWEKVFPPEQIEVIFYQDIVNNPTKLLSDFCQFVGVDDFPPHKPSRHLHNKVKAGGEYPRISPSIARVLAEALIDDIRLMHERYNNVYTEEWLNKANQLLVDEKGTN